MTDHPMMQLARINDWLAEYEPNLYWGTPDCDTADVVIDLLNRWTPNGAYQRGLRGHGVLTTASTVTAAPVELAATNVDSGAAAGEPRSLGR